MDPAATLCRQFSADRLDARLFTDRVKTQPPQPNDRPCFTPHRAPDARYTTITPAIAQLT